MRKKLQNHFKSITNLFIFTFLYLFQIIFFSNAYAQTLSVQGKITSSRFAVKNASVTFIDEADTSRKFTTLTNESGNYETGVVTSIESNTNTLPAKFELGQSYPNPFSSSTNIPYGLNKTSDVQVTIFDILGRVVRKFNVGQQPVGFHNVLWDGRNNFGNRVSTGIYFYRLNVGGQSQVKKMIFNEGVKGFVSLPRSYSPSLTKSSLNTEQNIQGGTYTVRIENTDNTTPLIVSKELNNVVIQNDTTINFAVENIPLATINLDNLHQYIRGFGAANIILWRPDMTNSEIETAFGTGDGQLGFSILRIMLEADTSRWSLYVPTAKKAYEMGATIIASPWFAPDEMSENVGNINRVRYDMYAEYATHLNSFNTFMTNNGVPIYGVSVQNEPDIEENWTSWTSDEIFTFMRDYAHVIEGTKVMAPESFHFDREYSDPILNDFLAAENTDIICGHIYGSGLAAYPLAEEKGKEVWMTEHLSGENSTSDDWSWALDAGSEMNDVMAANMSAYIWWYLVRYYGPISDGTYLRKGEVTKKGYVMSQFARFIRPGFYRVESSVFPSLGAAGVTAYKDTSSSKIIIVAINTGTAEIEQAFRIQNADMTATFTPYTTSASKNCEKGNDITVTNGNITITLEPSSITTFVSN